MHKKILIGTLRHYQNWLRAQTEPTEDGGWLAESIMIGAVQTINQCGSSVSGWIDRNGFRYVFKHIRTFCAGRKGKRALSKLIDLAVATLEAWPCKDGFWLGAMPLDKEPRGLTAAQKAALDAGRSEANRRRREEQKRRTDALLTRLSSRR